jgi:hypothetical protein
MLQQFFLQPFSQIFISVHGYGFMFAVLFHDEMASLDPGYPPTLFEISPQHFLAA